MTRKEFKPFWSFDAIKTEKWLQSMAADGYHLAEVNTLSRQFYFEEGSPAECTYRIEYGKDDKLSNTLADEGWVNVLSHNRWHFTRNEKPVTEMTNFPDQSGLTKRNKLFRIFFTALFVYVMLSILFPLFLAGAFLSNGITPTVEGSPMWIVTITVAVTAVSLTGYSTFTLFRSIKTLKSRTQPTY